MNRYTALFDILDEASSPAGLRQALLAALAESQAAGSYRLGSVALLDGQVAAEVACRLSR